MSTGRRSVTRTQTKRPASSRNGRGGRTNWGDRAGRVVDHAGEEAVHDDGSGPALYVAGSFTQAGGVAAENIARWDGTAWSVLGTGIQGMVLALEVHDDGMGAALFAGGSFTIAGGAPANRIARWDGAGWSGVGGGISPSTGQVVALVQHGSDLVAGGNFSIGVPITVVSRWDGVQWTDMGSSLAAMHAMESYGGELLVGGQAMTELGPILRRWGSRRILLRSLNPLPFGADDEIARTS